MSTPPSRIRRPTRLVHERPGGRIGGAGGGGIWSMGVASIAAALAYGAGTVQAQSRSGGMTAWDPRETYCGMHLHQSTVVDDKTLYLDGGEYFSSHYFPAGKDTLVFENTTMRWQNEFLWKLDLTKSWSASKPTWEVEMKPESHEEHYNGAVGSMWNFGVGGFTTVGGWFSRLRGPAPPSFFGEPIWVNNVYRLPLGRTYTYHASTNNWTNVQFETGMNRIADGSPGASRRNRKGYLLGGQQTEEGPIAGGFITVKGPWLSEFTTYDHMTGKFESGLAPVELHRSVDGRLASLDRIGKEGVLVLIGGSARFANGTERRLPQDLLSVYDVDSKTWFRQKATGEIPMGRRASCITVVPAPDFSSYQIYAFSGSSQLAPEYMLDLYVLTVPGFVWKRIPLEGYPDTMGIWGHSCALYSERQMLISGGKRNASTTVERITRLNCDQHNSVQIFDTVEWKFKPTFLPEVKENKVPQGIISVIGGDEKGNAKMKEPQGGFDSPKLKEIFAIRNELIDFDAQKNETISTPTTGGGKSTETEETDESKVKEVEESNNIGAIVGGVVGGLVGIGLVVMLVLFLRKRARDRRGLMPAEVGGQSNTPKYYGYSSSGDDVSAGLMGPPLLELPGRGRPLEMPGYYEPQELGGVTRAGESYPLELAGGGDAPKWGQEGAEERLRGAPPPY